MKKLYILLLFFISSFSLKALDQSLSFHSNIFPPRRHFCTVFNDLKREGIKGQIFRPCPSLSPSLHHSKLPGIISKRKVNIFVHCIIYSCSVKVAPFVPISTTTSSSDSLFHIQPIRVVMDLYPVRVGSIALSFCVCVNATAVLIKSPSPLARS